MTTPQPHDITLAISRDERDLIYRALSELRGRGQQRGENYRRQKLTVFAEECRRDVGLIEGLTGRLCAPELPTEQAPAKNPRLDLGYWRNIARFAIANPSPELVEKVAAECVATEARGENAGVWHALAVVQGFLDRCECAPCRRSRGEEGPHPYRYHSLGRA